MPRTENNKNDSPLLAVKEKGYRFRAWFFGILLLAGVVAVVTHLSEIEHFAKLARQAHPKWILVALLLQACTYICTASVWHQALHCSKVYYSLFSLVPLAFAKLFSDQVLPSGGASGISFFVAALKRRGLSTDLCMAILLLSIVSYYIAYLTAALTSIAMLWFYHAIHIWIIVLVGLFCLVALGIPAGALCLQRWGKKALPKQLLRMPVLSGLLQAFTSAPRHLLHNPSLVAKAILFYVSVFFLDAATLWVMLFAVGQNVSFFVAFPSFVVSLIVATLGPVPLGLGVFEASSVGMLNALGIPIEAALTATLLLRGFTLWLPMLPGLWVAKRELQ